MTIVDRQGHVVTQGAFNHCMAARVLLKCGPRARIVTLKGEQP